MLLVGQQHQLNQRGISMKEHIIRQVQKNLVNIQNLKNYSVFLLINEMKVYAKTHRAGDSKKYASNVEER